MKEERGRKLFVIFFALLVFTFLLTGVNAEKMWNFNNYTLNVSNDLYVGGNIYGNVAGINSYWNVSGSNLYPADFANLVGINTTTPQSTLNIIGSFNVTNNTGVLGLYQDDLGRVGVGGAPTSSYKLQVTGTTYSSSTITTGGDVYVAGGDIYDAAGDLHVLGDDNLYLKTDYNNDDADIRAIIFAKNTGVATVPTAANTLMIINETGLVGINTTTPQNTLNVVGDLNVTGTIYGATFDGVSSLWNESGSYIYPYNLSKNIGIGTNSPGATLDVNGNVYLRGGSVYLDTVRGYTNNNIAFANIGNTTFAGRVGINTTTPQNALNVVGDLNVTGTIYGGTLDASTLDSIDSTGFGRAYSSSYSFGGTNSYNTTAEFVAVLTSLGAFNYPYWTARGSWCYACNMIINDAGVGNIHLAGAVVEVMGTSSEYTIRITTPTTSTAGVVKSEFIYINNGAGYSPGWRKVWNSENDGSGSGLDADTLDGYNSSQLFGGYWNLSGSYLYPASTTYNVGIGTTSPANGKLEISDPTEGGGKGITIYNGSGTSFRVYRSNDVGYVTRGGSNTAGISIDTNGYVGMGVSDASFPLHLSYSLNSNVAWYLSNTNSLGYGGVFRGGSGSYYNSQWRDYNDNNLMTILGNGNLGIGTVSPSYTLDVNGSARTTQLLIDSQGSYLDTKSSYGLELHSSGDDMYLISGNTIPQMNINADSPTAGTVPTAYYWYAGTTSTYADHTVGDLIAKDNIELDYIVEFNEPTGSVGAGAPTEYDLQLVAYKNLASNIYYCYWTGSSCQGTGSTSYPSPSCTSASYENERQIAYQQWHYGVLPTCSGLNEFECEVYPSYESSTKTYCEGWKYVAGS